MAGNLKETGQYHPSRIGQGTDIPRMESDIARVTAIKMSSDTQIDQVQSKVRTLQIRINRALNTSCHSFTPAFSASFSGFFSTIQRHTPQACREKWLTSVPVIEVSGKGLVVKMQKREVFYFSPSTGPPHDC